MTALNASTRRVATAVALAAAAAISLSACSAGQISQTADQVSAVNGNYANQGDISLRNVHIVYPNSAEYSLQAGGKVALAFTAINESESQPERLSKISTDKAASVTIAGQVGERVIRPQTALAAGTTDATVTDDGEQIESDIILVTLNDIAEGVYPGLTVPITFTFERAGEITVDAPVDAGPALDRHESEKSGNAGAGTLADQVGEH